MSGFESGIKLLKEASQVPGLLKEIYGDLAKPGVEQVGKALGTIIGLGILWPISLINERANIALKHNLEKYKEQLKDVQKDEISVVAPEVGVSLAEKLSYVTNEELSDLYVNLLAKASTFKTANLAHPSFVNIINNLSPDEAILLKNFKSDSELPFIEARLLGKGAMEWILVKGLLTGLERSTKLSFPDNIEAYMSNFEGLGLIQVRRDLSLALPELYRELEGFYRTIFEHPLYKRETHVPTFRRGTIQVTTFGRLFISACYTRLNEV